MDSLKRLNIEPNITEIKTYFELLNRDTSDMDIPEYLLHLSKNFCDYKKLIELLKTSCSHSNDSLEFYFCPEDPFSNIPETVNVYIVEILKRWNTQTDLRKLLKIKNKHFHKMNILG